MSLDFTTIPIIRTFLKAFGHWGVRLHVAGALAPPTVPTKGTTMYEQDRDPVAASRRVSADEIDKIVSEDNGAQAAIQRELDLGLWDVRLAAILNTLDIARSHGEHRDWTQDHAAQIRAMMAIADQVVAGGEGQLVPQGFGPPVRAAVSLAFIRAKAAIDKIRADSPASTANGHDNGAGAASSAP